MQVAKLAISQVEGESTGILAYSAYDVFKGVIKIVSVVVVYAFIAEGLAAFVAAILFVRKLADYSKEDKIKNIALKLWEQFIATDSSNRK